MDKIDRIMEITNRYLERFGRALIGIYYLPPLAENWKFTVFINSLLVTLRRMDLMPGYTWFMNANGGHYLILWLNGYFRNDLSDVTPTVCRLWQIQSSLPLTVIDSIPLSADNPEYSKSRLRQFLCSPGLNRTVTANWHQRTFGMSRLR
ncbi:MAG: hypothetical protein E7050_10730 [Lentisphaerae bacterium]|nr:hypothetical protein [Lentisphaerota bacterium]